MTVSSTYTPATGVGNGVTTVLPFSFRIFADTDLVVTVTDLSGNASTLALGSGYSVTGAGAYAGGSVNLVTPLATGWTYIIRRVLPLTQGTSFRNQDQFFAELHEDAIDRLDMQDQQQEEEIGRAAVLPVGTPAPGNLPSPVSGSVLGWVNGAWAWVSGAAVSLAANLLTATAGMGTSLINYLAPFVGAVGRLLISKLADSLHPKDFGAVGNGVTDDTAAFLTCLTAASGKVVRLGGNSFALASASLSAAPIAFPSNVVLDGEGATLTITGTTPCNLSTITNQSNITIKNINFVGNLQANGVSNGCALFAVASSGTMSDISVTDCQFSNFLGDNWINMGASGGATIQNIRISRNKFTGGDSRSATSAGVASNCFGINSASSTQKGIWFTDNIVDCPKMKTACAVYNMTGVFSGDIHVTGNTIRNMGTFYAGTENYAYGILIYGSGGNNGVDVSHNIIDNCYDAGMYLNEIIDGVVTGNRVTSQQNAVDTTLMRGGICVGGSRTVVSNNTITNCQYGIQTQPGCTQDNGTLPADVVVNGNTINGIAIAGIKVRVNTVSNSGLKVTNNTIQSIGGGSFGIYYQFASATGLALNDVDISNNTITAQGFCIEVGFGVGITKGLYIRNNVLRNGGVPLYVYAQGDGTLTDFICEGNDIYADPVNTTSAVALTTNCYYNATASCTTNQLAITAAGSPVVAGHTVIGAGYPSGTVVNSVTNGGVAPCTATLSTTPGTVGSAGITMAPASKTWTIRNNSVSNASAGGGIAYDLRGCPGANFYGNVANNCTATVRTGGVCDLGYAAPWFTTGVAPGSFVQKMDAFTYTSNRVQTGWRFNSSGAWVPEWAASATW